MMGYVKMYYLAGILLVVAWLLFFLRFHDAAIQPLFYAGWAVLAAGLGLIILPLLVLRAQGRPAEGKDIAQTTTLVTGGIYAVVRHPLYLGWLLMYVAVMLFSQHWLVLILGTVGMASMVQISRQEDRRLVERFGSAYKEYVAAVPALNLLAGVLRLLRRGDNK